MGGWRREGMEAVGRLTRECCVLLHLSSAVPGHGVILPCSHLGHVHTIHTSAGGGNQFPPLEMAAVSAGPRWGDVTLAGANAVPLPTPPPSLSRKRAAVAAAAPGPCWTTMAEAAASITWKRTASTGR